MRSESEKKVIYDVVKAHLMGTPVRAPTGGGGVAGAAGAGGAPQLLQPLYPYQQPGSLGRPPSRGQTAAAALHGGAAEEAADDGGILRSLSAKWKFGVS